MKVTELRNAALFRLLSVKEFEQVSMSMNITEKRYSGGDVILHAGSTISSVILVLEGSVSIVSNDFWGNSTNLRTVTEGEFFGETCALLKREPLLADVCAAEDCDVLFIGIGSLMDITNLSSGQVKLLKNLLRISNEKNLALSQQAINTAPKSARGRIMAYLNSVAIKKNKKSFDIPLSRQEMADHLRLERTALSKELSRMKRDGLIEYRMNHFRIL